MEDSQVSGISVSLIANMRGVEAASIASIGGVATSALQGWPAAAYGYPLVDPNYTVTTQNASAGLGMAYTRINIAMSVDARANTDNAIYMGWVDQQQPGSNNWTRHQTFSTTFNIDKNGQPVRWNASNLTIANSVYGINSGSGSPLPYSLFTNQLYRFTAFPIFDDTSSYASIIINAGDANNAPTKISYQSYLDGIAHF